MTGASEFFDLSADFADASRRTASVLFDVFREGGESFRDDWQANATASSGKHGKHYPASITTEAKIALGINIETGPDSSKPQGGMGRGFEFGSRNQPPHLDGLRAAPAAEARIKAAAENALGDLLP